MKTVFFVIFSLILSTGWSTTPPDSLLEVKSDTIKKHSVRKATLLSVFVPGSGQVYNHIAMPKGKKKAFWKVPLIYAGLGATAYFGIKNNQEQKVLKAEYLARTEQGIYTNYLEYDNSAILQLYEQKVNRRDLFFMGLGLVYLLQVADAAVEAHFVDFDVSDDLSLRWSPTLLNNSTPGLTLTLNFR